jgi:hypothetical protein
VPGEFAAAHERQGEARHLALGHQLRDESFEPRGGLLFLLSRAQGRDGTCDLFLRRGRLRCGGTGKWRHVQRRGRHR